MKDSTAQNGSSGGGVYNNATVILNSCTLTGDGANGNGGGIFNNASATLTGCTLSADPAGGYGGGVYNKGATDLYQLHPEQ